MIFTLISSCYGINEETSEICGLSVCCNEDNTWKVIFDEHKIENIQTKPVAEIISEFKNQSFESDILYFKDYPEEYIGISKDKMSVRYVYNHKIANQVLNGLSPQLSDYEKIRISMRVNSVHMKYLNDRGRRESIVLMRKEFNDYLEKNK